jgi:hypothetical protein
MKHLESKIQIQAVTWFRLQYPHHVRNLFAIPNGAYLHGNAQQRAIQASRLKSEGVVSGVADLFLSVPNGGFNGFYIEMKTPEGKQSENQKLFEESVISQGYRYEIVKGVDQFIESVNNYLK